VIGQQQFTVRAARLGDAQLISDLINEVDLVEIGAAEYTPEEVIEDLRGTRDLASNSWLAFDGDRLVSYGILWNEFGNGRIDLDHYVRADTILAGGQLIDLQVARAAEVAAADGAEEAVIHLHLTPRSPLAATELPARGWRAIRRHHVLKRRVSVLTDPVPATPPGVTLRTAESPEDQETVFQLLHTSFADHFDHQPQTYPQWRERVGAGELDWSLVWIATVDGADVATLLGRNREAMAWVRSLGVLDRARGRGIGTFLLRTAFAEFAQRGRDTVGLGVDTENATGALRLYEGLGMTLHFAADTWEVRVPASR